MRQLLFSTVECASSGRSSPSGSVKTDAASKKVTPCFSRLRAAFAVSQSNTILYIRNELRRPALTVEHRHVPRFVLAVNGHYALCRVVAPDNVAGAATLNVSMQRTTVDELVSAVSHALSGCPAPSL